MASPLEPPSPKFQYTTLGILSIMATLGMTLAYVRNVTQAELWMGLCFVVAGLVAGSLIGLAARRFTDGLFWGTLVPVWAYLSILGDKTPGPAIAYGWGAVGAACGALCGVRRPRAAWLGALLSGIVGICLMTACVLASGEPLEGYGQFDVLSAGVVGIMLRILVEIVHWFQARSGQPRHVIAAWLTLSVIVGNLLVPVMTGIR